MWPIWLMTRGGIRKSLTKINAEFVSGACSATHRSREIAAIFRCQFLVLIIARATLQYHGQFPPFRRPHTEVGSVLFQDFCTDRIAALHLWVVHAVCSLNAPCTVVPGAESGPERELPV